MSITAVFTAAAVPATGVTRMIPPENRQNQLLLTFIVSNILKSGGQMVVIFGNGTLQIKNNYITIAYKYTSESVLT